MKSKSQFQLIFKNKLREAILNKYPQKKITASFFAHQYNLNNPNPKQISEETARKWLNGIAIPQANRLSFLMNWLNFTFDTQSTKPIELKNKTTSHLIFNQDCDPKIVQGFVEEIKPYFDEIKIEFR